MSIMIIKPEERFIPSFREALNTVAKEEIYILFLEAPPVESVREFVLKNMADGVPQVFAIEGDRVVGWADIFPLNRETINHRGRLGMGVLPDYRGKGLGKKLLEEVLKLARSRGLEKVELEVYASNQRAIALYKKMGFVEEGFIKKARKLHGNYEDFILMGLFL